MLIPTLTVRDMREAIAFHTEVLDFKIAARLPEADPFYLVLIRGPDELHLSLRSGRIPQGAATAILVCSDIDALLATYRARGLAIPTRPDSPVHAEPIDQSWGTREFYIDDPSGNTLILQQR